MSKLWEDLKQNMREWSTAAVDKAEEVSKIAVAKTEELTKISKIKIELHQLQRDLNKALADLGGFTHRRAQEDNVVNFTGNTEFFEFIQRVDNLRAEIDQHEAEIQKIKEEYDLKESEIADATQKAAAETPQEAPEEAEEEPGTADK